MRQIAASAFSLGVELLLSNSSQLAQSYIVSTSSQISISVMQLASLAQQWLVQYATTGSKGTPVSKELRILTKSPFPGFLFFPSAPIIFRARSEIFLSFPAFCKVTNGKVCQPSGGFKMEKAEFRFSSTLLLHQTKLYSFLVDQALIYTR
jgi:hypothetical protein